ncbi:MAG TPA: NADPH-dependent oxidoreductase [Clostridiales bacterium]|nr:NADPH-dependent oxidoreductase [Clostridiales bacterium]
MKITAIHSKHGGSTRAIATMLLNEIKKQEPGTEADEFTVAGFPSCAGCFTCFAKGEEHCPHYEQVHPVISSIERADVVILDSPTYCMGISGSMQSFLEHLGYRWLLHRPHPAMTSKIGVAISTTGGVGAKGVTKSLGKNFWGWGAAKSYRLAFSVMATNWNDITEEKKLEILRRTEIIARKTVKKAGKAKRGLSKRVTFFMMKRMMKKLDTLPDWFALDKTWWRRYGWIKE